MKETEIRTCPTCHGDGSTVEMIWNSEDECYDKEASECNKCNGSCVIEIETTKI